MKKITVQEIAISGVFSAIAITFGMFAHFWFLGQHVFLISIILFIGAFFIRYALYMLCALIAVFFADLYNNYLIYSYTSMVAYGAGLFIYKFLQAKNNLPAFILGVFIASITIILIYYLFDLILFGVAKALTNIYGNLLQFAICIVASLYLYYPATRLKGISDKTISKQNQSI